MERLILEVLVLFEKGDLSLIEAHEAICDIIDID
jgi:hypothetical protein